MRSRRNGQRNLYALTIGIGSSRIGRDILVVNINLTLDEPVVGRNATLSILTADIITVVDNGLCAMYEVTRRLPFHQVSAFIIEVFSRNSICVQSRQRGMVFLVVCTYSVFVLCIYETTTYTSLYVDEVKFDDTRDIAPIFLIEVCASAFLGCQLQIHTRGQRHLVEAVTIVALALIDMLSLPFIIGVVICTRRTIGAGIAVVRNTNVCILSEVYVTGQRTQIVHDAIDAEIVAMNGLVLVDKVCG